MTLARDYPHGNILMEQDYDLTGFTPLMLVSDEKKMHPKTHTQIVKLLIDHGAD